MREEKSYIMFSPNMDRRMKKNIKLKLGLKELGIKAIYLVTVWCLAKTNINNFVSFVIECKQDLKDGRVSSFPKL